MNIEEPPAELLAKFQAELKRMPDARLNWLLTEILRVKLARGTAEVAAV